MLKKEVLDGVVQATAWADIDRERDTSRKRERLGGGKGRRDWEGAESEGAECSGVGIRFGVGGEEVLDRSVDGGVVLCTLVGRVWAGAEEDGGRDWRKHFCLERMVGDVVTVVVITGVRVTLVYVRC